MSLVIIGLLVFNDNTGGGGGGGESETTTSSESGFSSSSETSSESGSSSSSSGEKTTSSKTTSSTSETTTATKPTSTANIEGDMPGISKSHMHVNGVVCVALSNPCAVAALTDLSPAQNWMGEQAFSSAASDLQALM